VSLSATARGLVRREGRSAEVADFEEQVIGFFIEAADLIGAPKSVAAIYGVCFASPEPLSFSEISERLDISTGSISQGLRVLKEVGALKVADGNQKLTNGQADTLKSEDTHAEQGRSDVSVSDFQNLNISRDVRGTRSPRYEPDLELRKLVLRWIEHRLQAQLRSGSSRLEQLNRSIPKGTNAKVLRERFGALQTWHDKSHALMPIVKTFLKLT
jgi:DNA-binding HxlR family transcriptional regulator